MKLTNANKNKTFGWSKTKWQQILKKMPSRCVEFWRNSEVLCNAKKTRGRKFVSQHVRRVRRNVASQAQRQLSIWARHLCISHVGCFHQILNKVDIFTSRWGRNKTQIYSRISELTDYCANVMTPLFLLLEYRVYYGVSHLTSSLWWTIGSRQYSGAVWKELKETKLSKIQSPKKPFYTRLCPYKQIKIKH